MKKLIMLVILSALVMAGLPFVNARAAEQAVTWKPGTFSLSAGAGARNFSEGIFENVYGSAPITFNVDVGVNAWKTLEIFLHTDYLKVEGKTTLTQEDSTLTIIPVELGARYLLDVTKGSRMKVFPYFGAGAGYYNIKEENPIGTVDESRVGFFAEGGVRFFPMKSFFLDVKLKYVVLESGVGVDLGGLAYMGALGISF